MLLKFPRNRRDLKLEVLLNFVREVGDLALCQATEGKFKCLGKSSVQLDVPEEIKGTGLNI